MGKLIGALRSHDELGTFSLPKIGGQPFFGGSVNHGKRGDRGTVSNAGKPLEWLLGFGGQTIYLPHHQARHVIRVALGLDATQVPRPSASIMIEAEKAFLSERTNKLNGEKGVAYGFCVDQLCQRYDLLRVAVKGIDQQPSQILAI